MTAHGAHRLAKTLLPDSKRASRWTRPVASCIDGLARFGYVAHGAVYISIGALSLLSATNPARRAEGPVGALQTWEHLPLGAALLCATAVGLLALAGWRFLQATIGWARRRRAAEDAVKRASKAGQGVADLALALSIVHLLTRVMAAKPIDDQASLQAVAQRVLSLPWGGPALIIVGGLIAASGLGNIWRSVTGHFTDDLDCDGAQARWAGVMGRLGFGSQGVALIAVGALTALAGWRSRPAHARGLGGALEALKDQPLGEVLLAALGAGFIAYGVFAFAKAWLGRVGR